MRHGTVKSYTDGCRCESCRAAKRRSRPPRRQPLVDRHLLAEALQDLFPLGLTDDCPVRRGQR
jgi:hypothetical protein